MTWLQRYWLRHHVGHSIWLWPSLSIVAALTAFRFLHLFESELGWQTALPPSTAQAVLGTMAASMFTFIVFVSSALLVAVQLASSQLTPRIIAIVFKAAVTKLSLSVFVFTFTFTLATLVGIKTTVPPLTAPLAAYSGLASLVVFLFLIDYLGKSLRPSGALWAVALRGRTVIADIYPRRLAGSLASVTCTPALLENASARAIPSPRDGVVLAFDVAGLVALARRADCVVELVPQVGDFVATGDPLFRVHHGGVDLSANALCQSVAVGQERTLEQDPTFAFRILVDIAAKGLSPAINDPTTAVLALDQIHHLLRDVGQRQLDDGHMHDAAGRLRLVYPTPDWQDFVTLAVTEIRQFGGTSLQIARRLRAMLENLMQTLPEERVPLLRQELLLLQRSAERSFAEAEDRARADVSDFQGIGGKHGGRRDGAGRGATPP